MPMSAGVNNKGPGTPTVSFKQQKNFRSLPPEAICRAYRRSGIAQPPV